MFVAGGSGGAKKNTPGEAACVTDPALFERHCDAVSLCPSWFASHDQSRDVKMTSDKASHLLPRAW